MAASPLTVGPEDYLRTKAKKAPASPAHTAGPWQDLPYDVGESVYHVVTRGKLESVAVCEGPNAVPNARLIAAAPRLLEMCSLACAAIPETKESEGLLQMINETIALAVGSTSPALPL